MIGFKIPHFSELLRHYHLSNFDIESNSHIHNSLKKLLYSSPFSDRHTSPIALWFTGLERCCIFYKVRARPSTSRKMTTCFITILNLLHWSGTEPTVFLRYTCIYLCDFGVSSYISPKQHIIADWIERDTDIII